MARPHVVLAGGTDFYPARVGRAIDEDVLDIGEIAILRGISANAAGWRLIRCRPAGFKALITQLERLLAAMA